jgi:hypothetical protein
MAEPNTKPPPATCPWCPETRPTLKPILQHMESAYHRRWCDLALHPPIASSRLQDGFFEVLSIVGDKGAWTRLREFALQLDTYAEGHADPDLTQRTEQARSSVWHTIEDHQAAM